MGIKSGYNNVSKIYVGSTPVQKIYYGTNLVYSSEKGDLSQWRHSNTEIPGKILLQEYIGSDWGNTIYVPVVNGSTVLNSDAFTVNNTRLKFRSVDIQNVPFVNNSMAFAFRSCRNLTEVFNIPDSTTKMSFAFNGCSNFNMFINFPRNGVQSWSYALSGCSIYNKPTFLPTPKLKAQGASLDSFLSDCPNFNSILQFPENYPLDFFTIFRNCSRLNRNITIPKGVASLYGAFEGCSNFSSWINIYSCNIGGTTYQGGTGSANLAFNTGNASAIPNVMIPKKYINDSLTVTYNACKTAGWTIAGNGSIVGTSPNRIAGWDFIGGDYNVYNGNGTHWILGKWNGALSHKITGTVVTNAQVPETITSYDTFPVALNYPCFSGNSTLINIDIGTNIPWVKNTMTSAFASCVSLTRIKGVVSSQAESMINTFMGSNIKEADLVIPEGTYNFRNTYFNCAGLDYTAPLPSTANFVYGYVAFGSKVVGNLQGKAPIMPQSALNAAYYLANRQENVGNIYVLSPSLTNIVNFWLGYPTTFKKPIHIYYQYSNGTDTPTYNLFKKYAVYMGTSGNASGTSYLYNATSNFYVYNISTIYNDEWNHTYKGAPAQKLITVNKYIGSEKCVALYANYPDWTVYSFKVNCFNNCRSIVTLALYNKSINTMTDYSGNCTNLFRNCTNLRVIQGLALDDVKTTSGVVLNTVNISRAFENCYNLRVMSPIPNTVTNMQYAFVNCTNFNFNVQLSNTITNMKGAFQSCSSLNQSIGIPNSAIDISNIFNSCSNLNRNIVIPASVGIMSSAFSYCSNFAGEVKILSKEVLDATLCFYASNKRKELYIPFKYENGQNTKTFNSFVSAGYLYRNGVSSNLYNTVVYDLVT